jgi:membrane protease subunit (stomatin/prohibitin family)
VSRFNDYLGEKLDTIFNLPGQYEAISEGLIKMLEQDFARFGIILSNLYINSITPPQEVQKAIDDKSKLGIFDDLNKLLKMKAAMAVGDAAQNPAQAGAGLGMGLGFMMPAMYSEIMKDTPRAEEGIKCPDCHNFITSDAKFCPSCGHQLLVYQQCINCGRNVPPHSKFCPSCGQAIADMQSPVLCSHCKTENLPGAKYCNQCGEKI